MSQGTSGSKEDWYRLNYQVQFLAEMGPFVFATIISRPAVVVHTDPYPTSMYSTGGLSFNSIVTGT